MFRTRFKAKPLPDLPIYAIGDIHGCLALFDAALDQIAEDAARQGFEAHAIVTIGDYIDRGPDSAGVIERVMALHADPAIQIVSIFGNHEDLMLGFLDDPLGGARWLRPELGGPDTLASFGLPAVEMGVPEAELIEIAEALRTQLGPERLHFITDLDLSYKSGNVYFCHAGTDPKVPLDMQDRKTLIWNRTYSGTRSDGNWTVHGHTVVSRPLNEAGRINLDTGAVFTGVLTTARIWNGDVQFIQTT